MSDYERTADGFINNCAVACGEPISTCQMCLGVCPDRAKFGIPDDSRIKPEIRALIVRGNVTSAELAELRCNSWEWEALVPAMTDEAFIGHVEHALKNCSIVKRPAASYDDAIVGVHAPEMVKRLKKLTGEADVLSAIAREAVK